MLIPGDLGFRIVAVVIFVVFTVIGVVLRRKWRLEVARREEISRLIVLAAEEAARAELESSAGYSVAASPVVAAASSHRVCAVCYASTSNRCARCKSVHYCSGKCQIIHWRQGHKDDCHPSLAVYEINDEASSFVRNTSKQPYSDEYITQIENDGLPCYDQDDNPVEGCGFSSPSFLSSTVSIEDEGASIDSYRHVEEPGSNSACHDSSVSFETCIDESTSDDDCLHILQSESRNISSTFDSFQKTSDYRQMEQMKFVEEKPYTGVDFGCGVSTLRGVKDDTLSGETSSAGLRVTHSIKSFIEPSVSAPGFWDATLDTSRTKEYLSANHAKPRPVGAGMIRLSNLKSTVPLSSEETSGPSSDTHSLASVMVDNNPGAAGTAKVAVKTISANKESVATIRHERSAFLSSKSPDTKVIWADESYNKLGVVSDTSKGVILPSGLYRANLDRNSQGTQQSLTSQKADVIRNQTNDFSSFGLKGETASAAKSVKADGKAAIHPQIARSTLSPVGRKPSMLKAVEQLRAPRSSKQGDQVVRINEKAVFAYDSFVKLYHWNKVEFRPSGLINCGNSCYANAVLQCLAFTPPLTAYLLQGLHSKACVKKEWCFTCEFERLLLKAKDVGHPQSPIGILSQIQKIGGHLTNGREEDAHEFLRYAIETMQSICLLEAEEKYSTSLTEETTLMGLAFGGYLRSKIKCTRCRGKSERQERMMDLTVEIEGDIETLEDALRHFTRTENLDGENKYHCARCKSYEKAKKKLSILEASNILTIALKRFQAGKFGKLNKSIQFPEILNLAPYMRGGTDRAPIYRLYGVVVHLDTMNASFTGHYVCYVRNAQNKWFKVDDSTVKPVELDQVLNKGAYMLFYSRCSPRAPRSIRNTIVSRDLSSMINNPTADISRVNHRINTSMERDSPAHSIHIPYDYELGSSSDNFSEFSNSDGVSTSTDSTQESNCTDDFSEFIFGQNAFFRSSDSDTSSSSSSSSSPQYMKRSPLSYSERYASALLEHNALLTDNIKVARETCRLKKSGTVGGVNFSHSNSDSQVRNLVNISNSEADAERLGLANPLDNGSKSSVHLRRLSRKNAD
ncbi:hypothetical protein vseg_009524 [Gypsophila vaccaria]